MQDSVTDAAEGFSELIRIPLNIVQANLTGEIVKLEVVYSEHLRSEKAGRLVARAVKHVRSLTE